MIATLSVVATKLRVTVPIPVAQNGIPHYAATGAEHVGTTYPTAIAYVSPGVYDLTYANVVAVADVIAIPGRDPALRSFAGAYVAPQTRDGHPDAPAGKPAGRKTPATPRRGEDHSEKEGEGPREAEGPPARPNDPCRK